MHLIEAFVGISIISERDVSVIEGFEDTEIGFRAQGLVCMVQEPVFQVSGCKDQGSQCAARICSRVPFTSQRLCYGAVLGEKLRGNP